MKLLPHKVVQSKGKHIFHNTMDSQNKYDTLMPKILSKYCAGAHSSERTRLVAIQYLGLII